MLVPKLRFKREDGTDYREWEEKTLQDVSSYITTTGTGEKSVYVGTENMRKNCSGVVLEDNNDTTVKGIQYTLNDVLVSNIRPYLKKAWRADRSGICSTDVLCIRGTSGILSEYLYTLLSSDSFFEYVMQGVKGTKMPRGDKKHIMDMPVSIPCLEEQQKIADFLSAVDEVIAQSEAEVQNLEQQKKAAMQKIFSQEVRFKREDGTEYPKWEKSKFADIYEQASEGATPSTSVEEYYKNGTIPFVKIEDTTNKYIYSTKSHITEEGLNNCSTWLIPENSVIFTNGATIGNVSINKISVTTKQGILGIVPKQFLLSEYLYYLFSTLTFQNEVHKRETKGTFATIILKSLNEIEVFIPCLEEQQKIADFLSAYDEAISYAKQELEHWKQLKKGLLRQMFV